MALPALTWRLLPPVVVPSTTQPSFILDAIYTAGTSNVYADGTARVLGSYAVPGLAGQVPTLPASGFAWTWNYDNTTRTVAGAKTACYAVPASGALNQQIIFMGIPSTGSVAGAVWKQFIDTRSTEYLYAGQAKNSGVYTSFDNATTPFTVGDFTGFAICTNVAATAGITLLYMWESQEAVICQFRNAATNGQVYNAVLGAFIDPLSTNAANAETDGRLYGLSLGGAGTMPATWLGTGADGATFFHLATAASSHFGTFTPGAGTIALATRPTTYTVTSGFSSRNGDLPEIPYQIGAFAGGAYYGQLRQMFVTRDSLTGIAWEAAGVQKGYLYAASSLTATDAMLLAY
jgi:hypothetical protein